MRRAIYSGSPNYKQSCTASDPMFIIQNFKLLPVAPRKFLNFSALNLISWQCIVGSVLVLFGRSINMPHTWIGILQSFLPLSMFLVLISIPAVEKFGPRRMILTTWLLRNLSATIVFLIPVAIYFGKQEMAWYLLMLSSLSFSIIRALGVGAWYPWLHEIVPTKQLGTYFSVESVYLQSLTIFVNLGVALLLGLLHGIEKFYWVYGIGIIAGLISVWYVSTIPGGEKAVTTKAEMHPFSALQHAIRDLTYRGFILKTILSLSSLMWISFTSILYLRDVLSTSDQNIMICLSAGALGVTIFVQFCFKKVDQFSTPKIMSLFMLAQAAVAIVWCMLDPESKATSSVAFVLVAMETIINAGFVILASKVMMSLVPGKERAGYTSLWSAGQAVANGIPPILAGCLISIFNLDGYHICFSISAVSALIVAIFWSRFNAENTTVPGGIQHIIKPQQPLRTLQRVTWLLLGIKKDDEK